MKAIIKDSAAPQVTTHGEQAASKVQSEDLKIPFPGQDKESPGDQQGMPLLWPVSEVLCGSAFTRPAEAEQRTPIHQVSEKNRSDLLSQKNIIPALRAEAKEILTLLSRYDQGLSIRDAQVLLNVVNILDQAVIVA